MRGYNPELIYSVTQIRIIVVNEIGNVRVFIGTAFALVSPQGKPLFVTNRHNVDLSMHPNLAGYHVARIEFRLRRKDANQQWMRESKYFEIQLDQSDIRHDGNADVAVIVNPTFKDPDPVYRIYQLGVRALIGQKALNERVFMMDTVSFIGYPGDSKGSIRWWDTGWDTPIARTGNLASPPHRPFENAEIKTTDVGLISALSFTGSSGSVVVLHEKGIGPGGDIHDPMHVPFCILGVMSGHWLEPEIFSHSGLSYFTRSNSIWQLIAGIH